MKLKCDKIQIKRGKRNNQVGLDKTYKGKAHVGKIKIVKKIGKLQKFTQSQ